MFIKVVSQLKECPKGETDIALSIGCEGCDLWDAGKCPGIGKCYDLFYGEVTDEQLIEIKSIVKKPDNVTKQYIHPSVIQAVKNEYQKEILSGMFFEWHPELTGNWEEDQFKYINLKFKNSLSIDIKLEHKDRK